MYRAVSGMTPPLIEIPRSMARHPNLAGAGAAPHGPKDMRSKRSSGSALSTDRAGWIADLRRTLAPSRGAEILSNTESRKVLFCEFVSLLCREPVEASGFPFILCQPAAAILVEDAEVVLREGDPLVGGEFVEASGFPLILRQPTAAILVEDAEAELRLGHPLVGGKLVEASGFPVVLRQPAEAILVVSAEIVLRPREPLFGGELVEASGFTLVLRQPAAA